MTRVGCAGGFTGEVLEATITYDPDAITILAQVEAMADGIYECPSNEIVPYNIQLEEAIGDRTLVDGQQGAVRWPRGETE